MYQYFQYQIYVTSFFFNGDLQLFPGVDQLPHLEVPYPLTNVGQQLRHASGRCPEHHPSSINRKKNLSSKRYEPFISFRRSLVSCTCFKFTSISALNFLSSASVISLSISHLSIRLCWPNGHSLILHSPRKLLCIDRLPCRTV